MLNEEQVKVGIAPIGWTNDDMPDLGGETPYQQTISEMALAGFSGSGLGNKYWDSTANNEGLQAQAKKLKGELEQRDLVLTAASFATYFTARGAKESTIKRFERLMFFLKEVGSGNLSVFELGGSSHVQQDIPVFLNRPEFSDEQWQDMVDGLNELGKRAKENGMKLLYHPHVGTGVQFDKEVKRLMDCTDHELVWLQLDIGHTVYAGGNPVKLIEDYADRIPHLHLKNIRKNVMDKSIAEKWSFLDGVREGLFTVPGDEDGMIDFEPIFQALGAKNFHGWLEVEAEQDPAKANPLEYAKKARKYIRDNAKV